MTKPGTWQPGQSGNPNGRPPKQRALTEILEKAGSKTVEVDGKGVARKRLIADMVMQAASTGVVTFPDATALRAEFKEWADFVKWIYTHIDGPARMDETGTEEKPFIVKVVYGERTNSTTPPTSQETD